MVFANLHFDTLIRVSLIILNENMRISWRTRCSIGRKGRPLKDRGLAFLAAELGSQLHFSGPTTSFRSVQDLYSFATRAPVLMSG